MEENKEKSIGKFKIFTMTLIAIILCLIAVCAAILLYTNSIVSKANGKILPETYAGDLDISGLSKEAASEKIQNNILASNLVLKSGDKRVSYPIEDLDTSYDPISVAEKAFGLGRKGNFIKRFKAAYHSKHDKNVVQFNVKIADDKAEELIRKNAKKFEVKEKSAKIIPKGDKGKIIAEMIGERIDYAESISKLQNALKNWNGYEATAKLAIDKVKPKYKASDFEDMTDILGKYSTEFDSGYTGRAKNIAVGVSKISGSVLEPDEELSVYDHVAPFTPENGYYKAGTYVGDEIVEDYGGGMCQVSTTLYNAVIRAELKVTERKAHSRTVHYVPLSADAAISGTEKDLKFKNNKKTPVYVYGKVKNGKATFYIFGKETRDDNRTIKFKTKVLSSYSGGEKTTKDPSLEEGKRRIESYGQTGYTAELWKYVYVDGKKEKSYQFNSSNYAATPTKVVVGTKKKDKDKEKKKKKGKKKK